MAKFSLHYKWNEAWWYGWSNVAKFNEIILCNQRNNNFDSTNYLYIQQKIILIQQIIYIFNEIIILIQIIIYVFKGLFIYPTKELFSFNELFIYPTEWIFLLKELFIYWTNGLYIQRIIYIFNKLFAYST